MRTPLRGVVGIGLACLLLSTYVSNAQKVDLDKSQYEIQCIQFPSEYVAPDQRTFGVRVEATPVISDVYSPDAIYQKIGVSGYQKVEKSPTVGITITLNDFRFSRSEVESRTEEVKDRNGKVTGTNYYYRIVATYDGRGNYVVKGPKANATAKTKTEAPANRFLTKASSDAADASISTVIDAGLLRSLTYRSGEYRSAVDASAAFRAGQDAVRRNLLNDYVNQCINTVNYRVSELYGYIPVTNREHLWILDSDKHPEYTVQQEAIKAVVTLTKTMKATEPLTQLSTDMQPLIEYFDSLKSKYTKDEKADRKMRYSAYFNLARIYLLLDQPDKAIAEANGLIKNDYDTKDGERIIEEAEKLKQQLAFHHTAERHMKL
ncbi:hypothetical protein [Fibrella arboris]|uniref:hypothetical protein n=1 Tax=Fibrella arboris TaxID=3242486 RepID=UPI003521E9E2